MRILVIDAFEQDDAIVADACAALEAGGHELRVRHLAAEDFTIAMSTAERRAYHDEGSNLLAEETRTAADDLPWAEALLFLCPAVTHSVPARLKGFLDRVFIPGVAFTFDDDDKLVPKLRHIRRVGLVTRGPHDRAATRRARDGARRSILWTVRLNCAWTCRRTYVRLAPDDDTAAVTAALSRW